MKSTVRFKHLHITKSSTSATEERLDTNKSPSCFYMETKKPIVTRVTEFLKKKKCDHGSLFQP